MLKCTSIFFFFLIWCVSNDNVVTRFFVFNQVLPKPHRRLVRRHTTGGKVQPLVHGQASDGKVAGASTSTQGIPTSPHTSVGRGPSESTASDPSQTASASREPSGSTSSDASQMVSASRGPNGSMSSDLSRAASVSREPSGSTSSDPTQTASVARKPSGSKVIYVGPNGSTSSVASQTVSVSRGPSESTSFDASQTTYIAKRSIYFGPSDRAHAEHSYSSEGSPGKLKRMLLDAQEANEVLRKKLKTSLQATRRLREKVCTLSAATEALRKNQLAARECAEMMDSLSSLQKDIFGRLSKTEKGLYSPEVKEFATTLYSYSPKAYSFVRKTFKQALPHPSQVRKWSVVSRMAAAPDVSEDSVSALQTLDNLTGEERANLVKESLRRFYERRIHSGSPSCDEPSANLSTLHAVEATPDSS